MSESQPSVPDANRLVELARGIEREIGAAEADYQSAVAHAVNAGEMLIEAKRGVRHGEWLPWLRDNCRVSEREARNYMRLARNRQRVADLPTVREAVALLAEPKRAPTRALVFADGARLELPATRETIVALSSRNLFALEQAAGWASEALDTLGAE